ncbi:protein INCA1 [Terrapene carolina triunguis]|uniref:protein INCA1 n=1 Tax=Terrapene triunguis TaxID=2587831 RepID=UPI000E77B52C|nr:protein INCA1 [Terrapene carolina triunguis]
MAARPEPSALAARDHGAVLQSKMVSRYKPEADTTELPTHQRGPCYNADEFWSGLSQRPSPRWMEEYRETSPLLRSSSAVHRPNAQTDAGSWPVLAVPQALPSPRELCRRRSGRLKRKRLENGGVMSVCYHLEDLKKRQSSIDQLKRLKWGGYGSPANSEGLEGAAVSLAEELQSGRDLLSRLTKPRPSWLCEEDSFVSCSSSGQWSCSMGEQQGIAEVVSSLVATADRPQPSVRCLPQETFWGFGHQPEE